METRRQILKSASMLAAVATVIPRTALAANPTDECELHAGRLCDSLAKKFGGSWQFEMTAGKDVMLLCRNS
jgi:hypothetical protein